MPLAELMHSWMKPRQGEASAVYNHIPRVIKTDFCLVLNPPQNTKTIFFPELSNRTQ
jgi:hypothetical protein